MSTRARGAPGRFCVTDVGSTTTKAFFFERDGRWTHHRAEVPTTVEKPWEDVTVGVLRALEQLEEASGRRLVDGGRPSVPYFSTSSAGGGLAVVVTGLVRRLTAETADRTALGAGAIVLDIIALDDGRTPYEKIRDLKELRPDMVLFAGGFDGEAVGAPVLLAELLLEAGLHPKLNPGARLPVVYAGNANARRYVEHLIGDLVLFRAVPNVRPSELAENLGPAREAILATFMDHVMSQAPGYDRLLSWVEAPVLPTPAAFGEALAILSRGKRGKMLAVDVGGATTDVFTAEDGEVARTVSANLGMSYSAVNVLQTVGTGPLVEFTGGLVDARPLLDILANKYIDPTRLPGSEEEAAVERAVATAAVREATRAHLDVRTLGETESEGFTIGGTPRSPGESGVPLPLPGYSAVVGSGGALAHSPRAAARSILEGALRLRHGGRLMVDGEFMLPHLGVLSRSHPDVAEELIADLAVVPLAEEPRTAGRGTGSVARAADERRRPVGEGVRALRRGRITLRRELAVPGEVLVDRGSEVRSDTVVARSVREFLRPYFLQAAVALAVDADELTQYLCKGIGEEVARGEMVARRRTGLLRTIEYRSPVDGTIEKMLPDGTLVVREAPELARVLTPVEAAEELGIAPGKLEPYLRCSVGEEVERGQPLAAVVSTETVRFAKSPVRGRVERIDLKHGRVMIEPLLEELEVLAWLPGVVADVTERGCVVEGEGTVVRGTWGAGGETSGLLTFGEPAEGTVIVRDRASRADIAELEGARVAALVVGGLAFEDVHPSPPSFPIVVIGAFGEVAMPREYRDALRAGEGRTALVDGTTQLRVGVRRPAVIVPGLR